MPSGGFWANKGCALSRAIIRSSVLMVVSLCAVQTGEV
jgi:hypothetical protein